MTRDLKLDGAQKPVAPCPRIRAGLLHDSIDEDNGGPLTP